MGIPYYFSHIIRKYNNIIIKLDKNSLIDNFYLDCNSIIYDIVYETIELYKKENKLNSLKQKGNELDNFEDKVIVKICEKIDMLINDINVRQKVIIAFDGVAPFAKLEQQRARRFKSNYEKRLLDTLVTWDTSAITPGTEFMIKLNTYVKQYFNSKNNIEFIVSTSDIYGEGEHKIFQYIREHQEYHRKTNTIIYGLDADLIMLSLAHSHIFKNVYLFRDNTDLLHYIQKDSIYVNNTNDIYLVYINELCSAIIRELYIGINNNDNINDNDENNKNKYRILDYIFICFLLGNDFLPHFPSLNIRTNGIQYILQAYKQFISKTKNKEFLINEDLSIKWRNFNNFILYLKNNEVDYFCLEYKKRDTLERKLTFDFITSNNIKNKNKNNKNEMNKEKQDKLINDKLQSLPIFKRDIEKYINPYMDGWQQRYYKKLFYIDIDDKRREQICNNYLEGLEWTFIYYTKGCVNWRWKYNYNYAPLLEDLVRHIPYFNFSFFDNDNMNNTNKNNHPVHPSVQLSYVLPYYSLKLLPCDIYNILMEKYDIKQLYPQDCKLEWSFCRYFWESHPLLPDINIDELEKIIYK